jgi:hypothetical protein
MPAFDIEAARAAGYSDAEIQQYMATNGIRDTTRIAPAPMPGPGPVGGNVTGTVGAAGQATIDLAKGLVGPAGGAGALWLLQKKFGGSRPAGPTKPKGKAATKPKGKATEDRARVTIVEGKKKLAASRAAEQRGASGPELERRAAAMAERKMRSPVPEIPAASEAADDLASQLERSIALEQVMGQRGIGMQERVPLRGMIRSGGNTALQLLMLLGGANDIPQQMDEAQRFGQHQGIDYLRSRGRNREADLLERLLNEQPGGI